MTNIKEQNVQVKISSDGCKATISLKQDPSHPNLSIDELTEILKDHGVVYGIQKEVMMIIVGKYRQGSEINSILVAEGVAPFEGVQPAVNYKFELKQSKSAYKLNELDKDIYGRINLPISNYVQIYDTEENMMLIFLNE